MSPAGQSFTGQAGVDELISALNRAIFMRESQQAARSYEDLISRRTEFLLPCNLQYDLARLLELGNEPRMALHAYEQILINYTEEAVFAPSLRGAGHLAYRLKHYKKCRSYLEKFLGTEPPNAERVDAEQILNRLPDGKGVPKSPPTSKLRIGKMPVQDGESAVPLSGPRMSIDADDEPAPGQYDAESSGVELSLDSLYVDTQDDEEIPSSGFINRASTEEVPVAEAIEPAPPASPDRAELLEAEQEPPPSSEESDDAGSFFQPAKTPPPEGEPVGELPADFPAVNDYGETPPLSMSSRDVVKKLGPSKPDYHAAPLPRQDPPSGMGWGEADREKESAPRKPSKAEPSWGAEGAVSPAASGTDLVNEEYAILVPPGAKDIKVESIERILSKTEGLDKTQAREAIVQRKGLLREKLRFDEVVEFYKHVRRMRQKLKYVAIDPSHMPDRRYDVMRVDVLDPGLRMKTTYGVRKTRWEHVRLISCGRLDREPTIDLFCKEACEHYRLRQGNIDFDKLVDEPGEDANQSARMFLEMLIEQAPDAILSHTVIKLVNRDAYRPQKFPSEDEYRRYNMVLLLDNFGKEIDPKSLHELWKQMQGPAEAGARNSDETNWG